MIKLRSTTIRNWGWIRNLELEFPAQGLVLVVGNNTVDTGGKLESVGAGKTLIGEAISRALVGVPGRFANVGWFANEQADGRDMLVRVNADLDSKPLVVELGYKCPELSRTGEGFQFTYDGRRVQRAKLDDTKLELQRMLKVSPELAAWSVFVDGDKLSFQGLSERAAVDLLMSALAQPPWQDYHKKSLTVLGNCKAELGSTRATHDEALRSVDQLQTSFEAAQRQCDSLSAAYEKAKLDTDALAAQCRARLASLEAELNAEDTELKRLAKEIRDIEDAHAASYAKLDSQYNRATAKLAEVERSRTSKLEVRATRRERLRQAKADLQQLESQPDACPTCGKPLDKLPESKLALARDAVVQAQAQLDQLTADLADLDQTVAEADRQKTEARRALDKQNVQDRVRRLSRECQDRQDAKARLTGKLNDAGLELDRYQRGPDRAALTAAEAVLEDRRTSLSRAKSRIVETAGALADAEAALEVVKFWAEAFGPTGIPNMILRKTLGPLNEVSRRLSAALTGNTVRVGYDTVRELASGKDRAELTIKVQNQLGSKRPEGGSKGETGLINLIIAETLAEVGQVSARVGFSWYDEVVKSQDEVVRGSIYSYLKRKAAQHGQLIFVVDHHKESANWADHILLVEKSLRGTTARWLN